MSDTPPAPKLRPWLGSAVGVAAGAAFAFGLYLLAQAAFPDSGLILTSVLLIPFGASALAIAVAGVGASGESTMGLSTIVVTTLILGSVIFFEEGIICIVMGAILFYPLGWLGGWLAGALRRKARKRTPSAMVALVPLLVMAVEQPRAYPTLDDTVVTQIEIAAPIDVVWREAVQIRDIAESEQTWTFTQDVLRIPRPIDARLIEQAGQYVRVATWRGDVRFYERVQDWRPSHSVAWTFDIPEAAADRLLDRHLRLDEHYLELVGGRYNFEMISQGRTRLTLRTRYRVRTPLNAYAGAWGALLLNDIHRNVLHVVRHRAEAAVNSASS